MLQENVRHQENDCDPLLQRYLAIREQTQNLAKGLSAEDLSAQSMPDASPGKWHLAHTTWFFERFILLQHATGYREFHPQYNFLFNSYYNHEGSRHARPQRGLLTRPAFEDIQKYRQHVDTGICELLATVEDETQRNTVEALLTIGLHHEMQHQELFLSDILNLFSHNILNPAVKSRSAAWGQVYTPTKTFQSFDGGLVNIGSPLRDEPSDAKHWDTFAYDCEQPQHQVMVAPFRLATSLVTNAQWLEFMADGAYDESLLWLSDGWTVKQREQWQAPLYWRQQDGIWMQFGLDGLQELNLDAPVCHISYYEAAAFAQWSGKRLARETEWELAAQQQSISGNFAEAKLWRPQAAGAVADNCADIKNSNAVSQLFGDVWEWTQSPFVAYPGFQARQGALGEYNGKFMANQFVLRGGSCITPQQQVRSTYRNFFYPHQRWQFSGVRLAEDV